MKAIQQQIRQLQKFVFSSMIFKTCMESKAGKKLYFDACDELKSLYKQISNEIKITQMLRM
jgi:hypothetical protein